MDTELDEIAERSGGYVVPPWALPKNPRGEADFTKIRQYSLTHNKPISKFTAEDYKTIGVEIIDFPEEDGVYTIGTENDPLLDLRGLSKWLDENGQDLGPDDYLPPEIEKRFTMEAKLNTKG